MINTELEINYNCYHNYPRMNSFIKVIRDLMDTPQLTVSNPHPLLGLGPTELLLT